MALPAAVNNLVLSRSLVGASLVGAVALTAVAILEKAAANRESQPKPVSDAGAVLAAEGDKPPHADATGILNHVASVVMAAVITGKRARTSPWLAIGAALATAPAALHSGRYLARQLRAGRGAWHEFDMADAVAHVAAFGVTCYQSSKVIGRSLVKK